MLNKYSFLLHWFFFSGAILSNPWALSAGISAPCAQVTKADQGFQITDQHGKIRTVFNEKSEGVECGAIISTHEGTAWIKTQGQTAMKFGPDTYFEFNRMDKTKEFYTLYRGRLLLQSPPQKKTLIIFTPQAQIEYNGGVAWVEYMPDSKITQVASFNKNVRIQNRFNEKAFQLVHAGEMSGMDFGDPRVVPKQPEVMSSASANALLTKLKLNTEERESFVQVVERVYDDRTKSLESELEGWKDISKPQEEGRSLASETKKDSKPSQRETIETIQEREAAFVMDQFKKRVYSGVQPTAERDPAAESQRVSSEKITPKKLTDPEYKKVLESQEREKQKVLKQLSDES